MTNDAPKRFLLTSPNWYGLGSSDAEMRCAGYRRQRVDDTKVILFGPVGHGVTHLQIWNAEHGGVMLASYRFCYLTSAHDDVVAIASRKPLVDQAVAPHGFE